MAALAKLRRWCSRGLLQYILYIHIYFKNPHIITHTHTRIQPVLHDWCNKGHGMCYPVCGMVHTKEPLLLIRKSSPCGSSGFPLSLSEWSFTICLTPYNRKWNVLSASLNKTFPAFPSFLFWIHKMSTGCLYHQDHHHFH